VNIYTTTEGGDVIYDDMFYSRKCGHDRMGAWRDKRAHRTEVSAAPNVLETTGGAKMHMASRWFS